ncbi:MAG: ATP-binding protein, partial [Candidatus Woesearchaeota archaeon]
MIVGKIIGKVTTQAFSFYVEAGVKKFDFVQVFHKTYDTFILCQITEIEKSIDGTLAFCRVLGYRDGTGSLKQIRVPFDLHSEVLVAEDQLIASIFHYSNQGAYLGKLEGKEIPIFLDLNKLLTKHVAVLAKSGAGKSYTVGVLLEEILEKGIPLLIIDPHGEYSTLKEKNPKDQIRMKLFGIEPKSYREKIKEYGNPPFAKEGAPIVLKDQFTPLELEQLLPTKLTSAQQGLLFSVSHRQQTISLQEVINALEAEESNAKWPLISTLQYLVNLQYFFPGIDYRMYIRPHHASIINLKGIAPEIQEIIVFKLLHDLFELRKKGIVPPFFTVIEEAHNFCPERSYGEKRSSKIIRTIASEGRKFGLGLCVVSQRPARVEKSVLSQCTTQIIMNVTNPNDVKAIMQAVEGLTAESGDEIKNLPIGTALLAGVVDIPLLVTIRPRRTLHGGETVALFTDERSSDPSFMEQLQAYENELQSAKTASLARQRALSIQPSNPQAVQQGNTEKTLPQPEKLPSKVKQQQQTQEGANFEQTQKKHQQKPLLSAALPARTSTQKTELHEQSQEQNKEEKKPLKRSSGQSKELLAIIDARTAPLLQPSLPMQEESLVKGKSKTQVQPLAQEEKPSLAHARKETSNTKERVEEGAEHASVLVPIKRIVCVDEKGQFPLLINLAQVGIITELASAKTGLIPDLQRLSQHELELLRQLFQTYGTDTKFSVKNTQTQHLHHLLEKNYLLQTNGLLRFNPA